MQTSEINAFVAREWGDLLENDGGDGLTGHLRAVLSEGEFQTRIPAPNGTWWGAIKSGGPSGREETAVNDGFAGA